MFRDTTNHPSKSLAVAAIALLAAPACYTTRTDEDIRVRDRSGLIYAARARATATVTDRRGRGLGIGGEVGGFATSGDYLSPAGRRDYDLSLGYAAAVADLWLSAFHFLPKVGIGYGDFEVEGQMRTLRDNGLGGLLGIESRFNAVQRLDVVARGSWFRRSSLDTTLVEVGLEWQPIEHVGFGIGYAIANNTIEESLPLFGPDDRAKVRTQGLLISMLLRF